MLVVAYVVIPSMRLDGTNASAIQRSRRGQRGAASSGSASFFAEWTFVMQAPIKATKSPYPAIQRRCCRSSRSHGSTRTG
jgi:hypothetical protein